MNWWCNLWLWLSVSGHNKRTFANPKGTRPGVQRNKRPLLACRTRCKCPMDISRNLVKSQIRYNKVQISNRVKNWCNAWLMEGVTVYGHHWECRVTFGSFVVSLRSRIDLANQHINGIRSGNEDRANLRFPSKRLSSGQIARTINKFLLYGQPF